ncbi:tandem-95 repeat protein, partial [Pseudomonas sp. BN102]|uniref:tandem-95 repeat protein n=1 Tax=Pseudomonas sp. BN102 TaxID=2567886 RepID=UPI0024549F75
DGDSVSYALGATAASHGTVTVHADGTFDYTPVANYHGSDSFSFVVSDGLGGSNEYTYDLTVNSVNDAPVNTLPGTQTTPAGTLKTISGLSIDDPDSGSGNMTVKLQVAHGTLSAQAVAGGASLSGNSSSLLTLSGTLAQINTTLAANLGYLSAANFSGDDTLTMTTSDGTASDIDSLGIAVTLVNNPPVATNDKVIVSSGTHVVISVATLLGNDFDVDGSYLSITGLNGAGLTNVTNLKFVDGSNKSLIEFDTASEQTAFGSFAYTLSDNIGGESTGTVTLVGKTITLDTAQGSKNDAVNLASDDYQASFIDGRTGNDNLTGGGSAVDRFIGGSGNDTLIGGSGSDSLRGGAGNDTLDGGDGLDMLDLSDATGALTFTLFQSSGDTNVNLSGVGLGNDTYKNMEGVIGTANGDTLTGSGGNDILRGGGGNDTLDGGAGSDLLDLSDTTGPLIFTLNQGTNPAAGSNGFWNTGGLPGVGDDSYKNMEGMIGSVFSDSLTGSSGNDVLIGGVGADQLTGGLGADTFRYANLSEGVDSILDYSFEAGDKLDFSALLGSSAPAGGLVSDYVHIVQTGADANVLVDVDGAGAAAGFVEVATLVNVEITGGNPLRASFWGGEQIIPG